MTPHQHFASAPQPDPAQIPADQRYVIYRWLSNDDFLLNKVVPDATNIEAAVDDDLEAVITRIPADAACFHFHLNCTLTSLFPPARNELIAFLRKRKIAAINASLTDISKRTIQRRCRELGLSTTAAARTGDGDELIIVKTDLNFGGDSEWALTPGDRATLGIGAGSTHMWKANDYQVLARKDIEESWWSDQSLVTEKYIGNKEEKWYRAVLLFDRIVLRELVNPTQIKKVGQSVVTRQWSLDASDERTFGDSPANLVRDLITFSRAFSMDFGAIDIMVDDAEEPFIIDVNSTPALHIAQPLLVEHLRGALTTTT
ncbi:MAG TPA: hypothetical protein VM099_16790 [Gemmatimonadaceae bacterium]|nr:hypothetical protein [Gemmatimonadaceae bacterium]